MCINQSQMQPTFGQGLDLTNSSPYSDLFHTCHDIFQSQEMLGNWLRTVVVMTGLVFCSIQSISIRYMKSWKSRNWRTEEKSGAKNRRTTDWRIYETRYTSSPMADKSKGRKTRMNLHSFYVTDKQKWINVSSNSCLKSVSLIMQFLFPPYLYHINQIWNLHSLLIREYALQSWWGVKLTITHRWVPGDKNGKCLEFGVTHASI